MSKYWMKLRYISCILVAIALSSCWGSELTPSTTALPTSGPTETLTPTQVGDGDKDAYPAPTIDAPVKPNIITSTAYPGPVQVPESLSSGSSITSNNTQIAYPGPAGAQVTTPMAATATQAAQRASRTPSATNSTPITTNVASPTNTTTRTASLRVTLTSTPTSTAVNAYPGPQNDAYPGPTQTSDQLLLAPTLTGGTPVIGLPTGTITPTQGIVRTSLVGSDPRDFHPVSGGYQFVVLFANWSPASKSMAPIFNAMEEKYNDKIQFVYLDIDDPANGFYKMLLGERLPPLIFILDGVGVVTRSWQGFTQRVTFEQALDGIAP